MPHRKRQNGIYVEAIQDRKSKKILKKHQDLSARTGTEACGHPSGQGQPGSQAERPRARQPEPGNQARQPSQSQAARQTGSPARRPDSPPGSQGGEPGSHGEPSSEGEGGEASSQAGSPGSQGGPGQPRPGRRANQPARQPGQPRRARQLWPFLHGSKVPRRQEKKGRLYAGMRGSLKPERDLQKQKYTTFARLAILYHFCKWDAGRKTHAEST